MKRRVFLFLNFFFAFILVHGENSYRPILEDGKNWTVNLRSVWDSSFEEYSYFKAYVAGDTTVDNKVAKKVILHYLSEEEPDRRFALKETDRVLYYYDDYYNDWSPLIDFNVTIGEKTVDSIREGVYEDGFTVIEEMDFTFQGIQRRCLEVSDGKFWIEGIGSPEEYYLTKWPLSGKESFISECRLNDKIIFNYEEYEELLKFSGLKGIEKASSIPVSSIFDLQGRQVSATVPGSIYIRDGRKFVAR